MIGFILPSFNIMQSGYSKRFFIISTTVALGARRQHYESPAPTGLQRFNLKQTFNHHVDDSNTVVCVGVSLFSCIVRLPRLFLSPVRVLTAMK